MARGRQSTSGARSRDAGGPPVEASASARGARLVDVLPSPTTISLRGAPIVTAVLPNGRTAWFRLRPAPASFAELTRLARSLVLADVRRAVATRDTALAIEDLARTAAADARRITRACVRGAGKLRRRIANGDAELDRKISTAKADVDKDWKRLWTMARRLRRRGLWDSLVIASAAPLFAAYGERGQPAGLQNFTLALLLAVWLAGDELSELLQGARRARSGPLRDADVWSYAAPFANLLAGWWLLHDAQHVRFVTGIAGSFAPTSMWRFPGLKRRVVYLYKEEIDVAGNHVARDHAAEFASFSGVPVIATLRTAKLKPEFESASVEIGAISAVVTSGLLIVSARVSVERPPRLPLPRDSSIFETLQVAWIVDTRDPSAR